VGPRAVGFLNQSGIKVITGANKKVKEAVSDFLERELQSSKPYY